MIHPDHDPIDVIKHSESLITHNFHAKTQVTSKVQNEHCECGCKVEATISRCPSCHRILIHAVPNTYYINARNTRKQTLPNTKAWGSQKDGSHYKDMGIQPMEFTMSNNMNPLQHTSIKYIARCYDKHDNPIIDLEKAKHCIDMLIDWEKMKQDDHT